MVVHHESIIFTAIATHANATYGDSLSPVYRTKSQVNGREGRIEFRNNLCLETQRTDSCGHEEYTQEARLDHKASGFGVLRGRAHERNGRNGIVEKQKKRWLGVRTTKNEETHPCLLLSMSRGATARMYVQVQMSRRITSRSDWKLKRADCAWGWSTCQFETDQNDVNEETRRRTMGAPE